MVFHARRQTVPSNAEFSLPQLRMLLRQIEGDHRAGNLRRRVGRALSRTCVRAKKPDHAVRLIFLAGRMRSAYFTLITPFISMKWPGKEQMNA